MGLNMKESLHGEDLGCDVFVRVFSNLRCPCWMVGKGYQMDVPKIMGTPKSSILIGFPIINHPFWGTPIFGNTQISSKNGDFPWDPNP